MPRALPVAEGAETPSMALPVSPQLARPVTRSLLWPPFVAADFLFAGFLPTCCRYLLPLFRSFLGFSLLSHY